MEKFTKYKAYQELKKLAEHPFDLTKAGNLTADRLTKFCIQACGFKLLYGTERVTEEVIQALNNLSKESKAVEYMQRMQGGEVLNRIEGYPSENRAVLHTATRDFFDQQSPAKEASTLARKEVDKLKKFLSTIEGRFTDLVMIGIGGSDLGPHANVLALQAYKLPGRNFHFISNVDPDDAFCKLRDLNLSKTMVVVVSKSGNTLETLTNEELVREKFAKAGLKAENHFVAVTGEGSPMDNRDRYLESFYIWDWVGGRYSSTSMVGGVVLSFTCGFDNFWEFLRGANAMDKVALEGELSKNLPLFAALIGIWNRNFLGYPTTAIIPYSQGLIRYPAHLQQADMESNGKRIDREGNAISYKTGPIIWGEPGTNAQHSFFQLIHQGTDVIPLEFVGFKENQFKEDFTFHKTTSQQKLLANLFAQSISLATGKEDTNPNKVFPGNRPSHTILGKQLTPYSLGALLSFFENKVAFQGFIWNINSFDQEGVQLGKVLANKIISRFADKGGEPYPLGDALIHHLESL